MSIKFFEQFSFEESSSDTPRRLTSDGITGWTKKIANPFICGESFEFDFLIHELEHIMIGLVPPDYDKEDIGFGKPCWCLNIENNSGKTRLKILDNSSSTPPNKKKKKKKKKSKKESWKIVKLSNDLSNGDIITFYVDRTQKSVHVKIGRQVKKMLVYENVTFPEEIAIGVSIKNNGKSIKSDVELVRYEEKIPIPVFDEKDWKKKKTKHFRFACWKFSNFCIPLQKKILKVPKVFLIHSKVGQDLEFIDEYDDLQHFDLDIDSRDLCQIMLNFPNTNGIRPLLERVNLVDHYVFFRSLGLKTGMWQIMLMLNNLKFKDLYDNFRRCADIFENKTLRSWFTETPVEPENYDIHLFDTVFCMGCFIQMKKKISELDFFCAPTTTNQQQQQKDSISPSSSSPPPPEKKVIVGDKFKLMKTTANKRSSSKPTPVAIMVDEKMMILKKLLTNWDSKKKPLNIYLHKDLKTSTDSTIYKIITKLREKDRSYLSNVKLISSDGKKFKAHKEILLCGNIDRFYYLFQKKQQQDIQQQISDDDDDVIHMDMNGKMLEIFLDVAYRTSDINECPPHSTFAELLEIVLQCYVHNDSRLLHKALKQFDKVSLSQSQCYYIHKEQQQQKAYIKDEILGKFGHLLQPKEEVWKWVVPRLIRFSKMKITEAEILRKCKKMYEQQQVRQKVSDLESIVSGLQGQIEELRKVIAIQKEEMDEKDELIRKLKKGEGGENDEDDAENNTIEEEGELGEDEDEEEGEEKKPVDDFMQLKELWDT